MPSPSGASTRAFTLLEILIAIALIGLLASVFIMGTTRLLREDAGTAEEEFQKALAAARKIAVEGYCEVRISFDSQDRTILLKARTMGATTLQPAGSFPLTEPDELIDFLVAQKGGGANLVGGILVETTTVPFVTVYADGTCSSFRVQFRSNGTVYTMEIDPWTCAPVLDAPRDPVAAAAR